MSEVRDEAARTQTTVLRYERYRNGETITVDRPWQIHWYTRSGFGELAAAAGLTTVLVTDSDGNPAARTTSLHYRLRALHQGS